MTLGWRFKISPLRGTVLQSLHSHFFLNICLYELKLMTATWDRRLLFLKWRHWSTWVKSHIWIAGVERMFYLTRWSCKPMPLTSHLRKWSVRLRWSPERWSLKRSAGHKNPWRGSGLPTGKQARMSLGSCTFSENWFPVDPMKNTWLLSLRIYADIWTRVYTNTTHVLV